MTAATAVASDCDLGSARVLSPILRERAAQETLLSALRGFRLNCKSATAAQSDGSFPVLCCQLPGRSFERCLTPSSECTHPEGSLGCSMPQLAVNRVCARMSFALDRIVLMGQGGVGKTAMVLRYTTGDFNEQVSCFSWPRTGVGFVCLTASQADAQAFSAGCSAVLGGRRRPCALTAESGTAVPFFSKLKLSAPPWRCSTPAVHAHYW